MTINLEILDSAYVYDEREIQELNTKVLVPKMMTRRRLTRASKMAIYLANEVSFTEGRVIYGSSYGELGATANILDSIQKRESISPTHFQNSVYNTAIAYLSMLQKNQEEIMTLSCGDRTSQSILKMAGVKALDRDTLLLMVTESLNIPNIDELNRCQVALECGVALKVKLTHEPATIDIENFTDMAHVPNSIKAMFSVAKQFKANQKNIIEVSL